MPGSRRQAGDLAVACIVGGCEEAGTVEMTLAIVPPRRERFCEKHARPFDDCWQRVGAPVQMTLGGVE